MPGMRSLDVIVAKIRLRYGRRGEVEERNSAISEGAAKLKEIYIDSAIEFAIITRMYDLKI
jgi:hypothetical protein